MEGTQESQDLFCMFKSSNIARVKLRECIAGSVLWTSHLESNSVDALVDGCSMSKHWLEYSFESLVVVGASALLVVAFSTPPTSTPADRPEYTFHRNSRCRECFCFQGHLPLR